MYLKLFSNQPIEVIPSLNCIRTEIQSTFRTAWKVFDWAEHSEGVGLNEDIVKFAAQRGYDINIKIENERYLLNGLTWLEKGNKYQVRNTKLLVIPIGLMEVL